MKTRKKCSHQTKTEEVGALPILVITSSILVIVVLSYNIITSKLTRKPDPTLPTNTSVAVQHEFSFLRCLMDVKTLYKSSLITKKVADTLADYCGCQSMYGTENEDDVIDCMKSGRKKG